MNEAAEQVRRLAAERRFADAADAALGALPGEASAARNFVRNLLQLRELSPFGSNVRAAEGMEGFYAPLTRAAGPVLGATSDEAIALVERLTMIHAYAHRFDDAAAALRPAFDAVRQIRSDDDPLVNRLRYMLKTQYENAGRPADAAALLPAVRVCRHLRPVDEYLRSRGAQVMNVTTPWSKNCRHWVIYRGVILNTASLVKRFDLVPPVEVHDHVGTHDGSEHGLVCTEHHDALIGAHPRQSPGLPTID